MLSSSSTQKNKAKDEKAKKQADEKRVKEKALLQKHLKRFRDLKAECKRQRYEYRASNQPSRPFQPFLQKPFVWKASGLGIHRAWSRDYSMPPPVISLSPSNVMM